MSLKGIAKSVAAALGYEVRRRGKSFYGDPYTDQVALLRGRDVRVILDLGANLGQTALRYGELFPGATVHSFEPFEETFRSLTEALRGRDRLRPHRAAVADAPGTRTFFYNKASATNSLLPVAAGAEALADGDEMGALGSTEVPAITLDDFCAEQGIAEVQILKLDIQGGELMALRGAAGMLGRHAIDLVFTEVLFGQLYDGQADFADLYHFLKPLGYSLYGLYDLHRGTNGMLAWADAIFVGPRLRRSIDGA